VPRSSELDLVRFHTAIILLVHSYCDFVFDGGQLVLCSGDFNRML